MGRHLNVDRWFDRTSTGTLQRKRVSAEREKQFPIGYRKLYQQQGLEIGDAATVLKEEFLGMAVLNQL